MAALTCTLASIANGAGRVSARVDNRSDNKHEIGFRVRINSGSSAPTVGTPYLFYLHRQDDLTPSHSDDTVGEADAAVSTQPDNSRQVGKIIVTADTDTVFETSFTVYDPGPYWSLSMWNATGQTISATEADHYLRYDYLD